MNLKKNKIGLSDLQISTLTGDEVVILNYQKGLYFGLNETGTFIWNKIKQSPKTFAELKTSLLNKYEADESIIEKDLIELLQNLHNEKLITLFD